MTGKPRLEIENVSFSYDDRPVLQDISFQLIPGTVLGLLGRTGSGKTTLSRLLFRLYDPDEGIVSLGCDASGGDGQGRFTTAADFSGEDN